MDKANEKRLPHAGARRLGRQEWLQTWVFPLLRLMFPLSAGLRRRPAVLRAVVDRTPRRR